MIGKRLSRLRKQAKISQKNLAEKLGVARSTLAMWESNGSQPSCETLIKFARYFRVSTDYLLGIYTKGGEFMKYQLGKEAEDKITSFKGILTGRASYITGCDQYCITKKISKNDGEPVSCWLDEGRIKIIGDGIEVNEITAEKNGGPYRGAPTK